HRFRCIRGPRGFPLGRRKALGRQAHRYINRIQKEDGMKKRLALWSLAAMVIGIALVLGPVDAADTVKIGVVGPRTGEAAATGKVFEEGIQLATAYVNANGGVLGKT